jgi:hypothetical protein
VWVSEVRAKVWEPVTETLQREEQRRQWCLGSTHSKRQRGEEVETTEWFLP